MHLNCGFVKMSQKLAGLHLVAWLCGDHRYIKDILLCCSIKYHQSVNLCEAVN